MPTGHVLVWHLRIMMQPMVISGAVANLRRPPAHPDWPQTRVCALRHGAGHDCPTHHAPVFTGLWGPALACLRPREPVCLHLTPRSLGIVLEHNTQCNQAWQAALVAQGESRVAGCKAGARPNSSAPSSAATARSRPVCSCPSTCRRRCACQLASASAARRCRCTQTPPNTMAMLYPALCF